MTIHDALTTGASYRDLAVGGVVWLRPSSVRHKMKTIALITVIMAFLSVGCSQRASRMNAEDAVSMASELRYVHDSRTNLCFATVASRHVTDFNQNGFTITYVPCTTEVLKLINSHD